LWVYVFTVFIQLKIKLNSDIIIVTVIKYIICSSISSIVTAVYGVYYNAYYTLSSLFQTYGSFFRFCFLTNLAVRHYSMIKNGHHYFYIGNSIWKKRYKPHLYLECCEKLFICHVVRLIIKTAINRKHFGAKSIILKLQWGW